VGLWFRGNKTLQPQQLTDINRVVERSRNPTGNQICNELKTYFGRGAGGANYKVLRTFVESSRERTCMRSLTAGKHGLQICDSEAPMKTGFVPEALNLQIFCVRLMVVSS